MFCLPLSGADGFGYHWSWLMGAVWLLGVIGLVLGRHGARILLIALGAFLIAVIALASVRHGYLLGPLLLTVGLVVQIVILCASSFRESSSRWE